MWHALHEQTHSVNKQVMDDCLAEGRRLVDDVVEAGNKDIVIGFDGCHNHIVEASCGGAAFMGLSPPGIEGVIVEVGALSKKLTKFDRDELNMEEFHFSDARSSKGMEGELAERLMKDAALHRVWIQFLASDRDSTSWSRMQPGARALRKYFQKHYPDEEWREMVRLLCIGHDLVNFEKELIKQAQNQSTMVQRNLCAENVGGTCGNSAVQGKKKGTTMKGKRKRCKKMTLQLAKRIKRAMSFLCYKVLTPENCPTTEAIKGMEPVVAEECQQKMEHFTQYDLEKHPNLKDYRITCAASIAGLAAGIDKFVVKRVVQHCAPGKGALTTSRLEGLWAQILKRAPKSDNLLGIESINAFLIAIAYNAEIPLCKQKAIDKDWEEAIYVRLARAYEAKLGLEAGTLMCEAGAARVRVKRRARVADSVRRGTPEFNEKRARAKKKRQDAKQAAKQEAKDAKGYKSAEAVAANWADTDPTDLVTAPGAKPSTACVDCGKTNHKSGRAKKSCTAAGIAKYLARKQAKDEKKAAGEKKKVPKIEAAGQQVVEWCDVWALTKRISIAMKKDPTVHQEMDR